MANTKIVALQDFPDVGLYIGREYDTEFSHPVKEFFVQRGRASWVGDTYPKGSDEYEDKVYGKGMLVIKNGCTYKATQNTGNTWNRADWKLLSGIEDYVEGISYNTGNLVFKSGTVYRALEDTDITFILAEWDIRTA